MPSHVYVGVDLGGTRIRAAAVSSTGTIDKFRQRPTQSDRPAMHIVEDVVELVQEVAPVGLAGIGVGVPTTLDERGCLRPCLNLPTFGSFNLGAELQTRLNTKVQLENDARCFTLGEWAWGAARGVRIAVGLTLGTSVGLGIVVDGVPFRGAHGDAGEIWRSPTR